ncbi:hypothetical protein ID866_3684 [Astraeus odoratus]|nr:hypothetical protein ID866_3684 [Astraeus odoratus]
MDAPIYYSKAEFIETDTGNKVSRRATIAGPQNIILGGKTIISSGAIIRGDLRRTGPGHAVVISLGRYCLVGEGCVMSVVEAATIGNHVVIGKNCIIGKFTIIKDCAQVADNTVIPPNSVVPALALFSGSPGRWNPRLLMPSYILMVQQDDSYRTCRSLRKNWSNRRLSNIIRVSNRWIGSTLYPAVDG